MTSQIWPDSPQLAKLLFETELYESLFKGFRAAGDSPRWSLRHPGPIETFKYDTSKNQNFIKIFLLMNGCNHWISQNLKVQFDFPWNQQMRNILEYRFRTGTSCFELSDFEKYSKYHPKLNQKLVSSARRAKPDLARHAPASIITLRDRALRVTF